MKQGTQETTPKRTQWVDIARGIAIITVVMGHVNISVVSQLGLGFQLPLFAMLTGILWKDEPLDMFIRKKIRRLFVPFFITALVSLMLWLVLRLLNPELFDFPVTFYETVGKIVLGLNPIFNAPLWFVPSFFVALVVWRLSPNNIASLVTLIGLGFLMQKVFITQSIPYAVDLSLLIAGCIGIGALLGGRLASAKIHWIWLALSLILFLVSYRMNGVVNFYGRQFGSIPLFLLENAAGALTIILVSKFISGRLATLLSRIGRQSLSIMLWHWPLLLILNMLLYRTGYLTSIGATSQLTSVILPPGYRALKLGLLLLYSLWGIGLPLLFEPLMRKINRQNN